MQINRSQGEVPLRIFNTVQSAEEHIRNTELLYILEGSMDVTLSGRSFRLLANDLLVINAGERVRNSASADILYACVMLPDHQIQSAAQSADIHFICDPSRQDDERYAELRNVLRQLLDAHISLRSGGQGFRCRALYYQLLELLTAHFLLRVTVRRQLTEQERLDERIAQIDQFLQNNYHQPISSKDLAEALYLSQGYLIRFFKKHYGVSFAEYLTQIRLHHAVEALLYTDLPVTHIAYESGFSNAAAFNKAFKLQYNETPTAMRRAHRQSQSEPAMPDVVEQRLEAYLRATEPMAAAIAEQRQLEHCCAVDHSEELRPIWRGVNIGAAAELLRSDIREHILLLAQEMNVRYVRFWNLFSDEMLLKPNAQAYNFSKLDDILDFLTEHGLKPHIELGQKPKRLFRTLQSVIIDEPAEEEFPEPETWGRFLRHLMGHLQRRYQRSELDSWRIELWFTESQWGDPAAAAQYFTLFNITRATVRQYNEHMEVGGCGLRMFSVDAEERNAAFLQQWSRQPQQPDFLSMLHFDYEESTVRQERYSRRSADSQRMRREVRFVRDVLCSVGMERTRIYITEWNLTLSDRNYINDTSFKGAYVLCNMLEHYGLADDLIYFLGSDRVSEHLDSGGFLHGGSGLVTKDGIPKPAGFAYQFLSWLYPYYVGGDDRWLLTTDRHGAYGLVCHNQCTLNHQYYLTEEDSIRRDRIGSYFADHDPLQLTLTLTGLSAGQYQIKTYQVNEQSGDTLSAWEDMGYETELSKNDIAYLQRICGPRMTIQTYEVSDGTLHLRMDMEPNELRFVRVRMLN